jgi:band 4.1-like protein 1/2/3
VAAKKITKDGINSNLDFIAKEAAAAGIPFAKTSLPAKRRVKIMAITAKIDSKSKKIDAAGKDAIVDHSIGVMDTETKKIETKLGVIDMKTGQIEVINNQGAKENIQGNIDSKTGQIQVASKVMDPVSGKIDESLGQIIFVSPLENAIVEIVALTGKLENGKVDIINGDVEISRGVMNTKTGFLDTKYGKLNINTNEIVILDPKTGKPTTKHVSIDETGQITIFGVMDPKTGQNDAGLGHLIVIGQEIDPIVQVQAVVGKLDKNGLLDPKTVSIDASTGQLDTDNMRVNTKYGQFDLVKRTVAAADSKTGKIEVKDLKLDPASGQILLKNQVNPKTQKPDRDWVRLVTLRVMKQKSHPRTGQVESDVLQNEEVKIDPKTNQIWVPIGRDSKTRELIYQTSSVDPSTGVLTLIIGYLNPKTNEIERSSKLDPNLNKIDPQTGQIYTATGDVDDAGEPIFAASQVDSQNGEIYTKLAHIDKKTGKLVIIRIMIMTKKDEQTGKAQEVDLNTCEIDPISGRIQNVINTTVYVYKMVDPVTGEVINVDPSDPRVAGARQTTTTVFQLSGIILFS